MLSPNVILHIPHSSRNIPPEERAQLAPDDRTLVLELLRMTDALTDELFAPTSFEAARVIFPISRLACDVERFPDDADEPMALKGMGVVYAKTTDGQPLREHLTLAERTRVMEAWYTPHHQKLTRTVDDVIADGKSCIIVDCHSFSSRPLPHEPDQEPIRPDICIGTDDWHTPARLRNELIAAASAGGFSVRVDRPFSGALVPAKHHRREPRVKAAMIEINRQLYMNEETGERLARFDDVSELEAIKAVFGREGKIAVSATKSATGHLLGAAGGAEAIFTILALRDQVAPPTLNLDNADASAEGVDIVAREARRMPIEHAISNGFGFGGVNASIIFRRWQ